MTLKCTSDMPIQYSYALCMPSISCAIDELKLIGESF